jgi:hypothetical protein
LAERHPREAEQQGGHRVPAEHRLADRRRLAATVAVERDVGRQQLDQRLGLALQ